MSSVNCRLRALIITLMLVFIASSCFGGSAPKNVILLIGDGMGIGHVTAARCAASGPDGRLAIDTMPYTGFALTHSAKALVTDSAAAGTALATGVKTYNGGISVNADGKPVRSILEVARDMGKATGLVSTKFITDATPAVFAAHVANRGQRNDIAAQMLAARVHVVLGGGRQYFVPKASGGAREDGRDLLEDAKKRGYDVFETADALQNSESDRMLGLFAKDIMLSERPEPTIAEMTSKAISSLSKSGKGFFLMSEGGKIDSEAHGNNAAGVVKETLMFDDAVRVALEFAKSDENTLVVVTADHDTGGMAVRDANEENPQFTAGWVTGNHTGNMVPIYAYGPGAELFTGTHDNTEIPKTIARLWGRKLN